jgi:hypothetical protein
VLKEGHIVALGAERPHQARGNTGKRAEYRHDIRLT